MTGSNGLSVTCFKYINNNRFNIQQFQVQYSVMYVFCVYVRTNSDYFPIQY